MAEWFSYPSIERRKHEKCEKHFSYDMNNMHELLQQKWTFEEMLPIQEQMFPLMKEERDILAISPTGSGKTLAFALPLIDKALREEKKETFAVIVTPSQELSMQIVEVIREWVEGTPVTVTQLIGGANPKRQEEQLKKKPNIVVGTPGRIHEHVRNKKLKMHFVEHLIVDEADQFLTFEKKRFLQDLTSRMSKYAQFVAVSATLPEDIEEQFEHFVNHPAKLEVKAEDLPKKGDVVYSYIAVEDRDKMPTLRGLAALEGMRGIAFMNALGQMTYQEWKLEQTNTKIGLLHSDLKKEERERTLREFRQGKLSILLATDVAARGLDIEGVTHVIHFDLPPTKEQFIHRSGRTGRNGADGEVLSFVTYRQKKDVQKLTRPHRLVHKEWKNGELREVRKDVPKKRHSQKKRHRKRR